MWHRFGTSLAVALNDAVTSPRLWLVRHAQPLVEAGVCYGSTDMPADVEHTRASALKLHQALPSSAVQWRCSPLQRCEQLAQSLEKLRGNLRPSRVSDVRLREMNFGKWEGQRWEAIERAEIDAWTQNFNHYAPGDGEALATMFSRVREVLTESRTLALREQQDIVWITHAGVIHCVLWLMQHGNRPPMAHEWTAKVPRFGEWISQPLEPAQFLPN